MSYVFPPYTLMGFLEFLGFLTFFILGLYVNKHAQSLIGTIDGKILLFFVMVFVVFHCSPLLFIIHFMLFFIVFNCWISYSYLLVSFCSRSNLGELSHFRMLQVEPMSNWGCWWSFVVGWTHLGSHLLSIGGLLLHVEPTWAHILSLFFSFCVGFPLLQFELTQAPTHILLQSNLKLLLDISLFIF